MNKEVITHKQDCLHAGAKYAPLVDARSTLLLEVIEEKTSLVYVMLYNKALG
jgi:hypothetical protein